MSEKTETQNQPLSGKLIAGIVLLPIVFVWFTLKKGVSTKAKVLSFLWLIIAIGALGGQQSENPLNTGSSSSSSSSSSASIAGYVTAPEIFAEYEANEIAADSKYKGKYWSISGTVDSIGKDILDNMFVTLVVGEFVFGGVQAFFDDSEAGVLGSIQKGANVEIVCKVDGKLGNVLCRDSKLAQ